MVLVKEADVELMELDEDVGVAELEVSVVVVEDPLEDVLVVLVPLGDGAEMK